MGNLGWGMHIGFWEAAIVLIVVLIIFGAGKLPGVMSDLGKGVRNFRAGLKDNSEGGETRPG